MSEQHNGENPFESPQQLSPAGDISDRATIVRRVIVLLLSILLIPPAVCIAFFFGCLFSGEPFDSFVVGCVGGAIAALAVLVGMCYIANKLWNKS